MLHFFLIIDCKPVMIWASLRHGTRYPGIQTIENMRKLIDLRSAILENHEKDNSSYTYYYSFYKIF